MKIMQIIFMFLPIITTAHQLAISREKLPLMAMPNPDMGDSLSTRPKPQISMLDPHLDEPLSARAKPQIPMPENLGDPLLAGPKPQSTMPDPDLGVALTKSLLFDTSKQVTSLSTTISIKISKKIREKMEIVQNSAADDGRTRTNVEYYKFIHDRANEIPYDILNMILQISQTKEEQLKFEGMFTREVDAHMRYMRENEQHKEHMKRLSTHNVKFQDPMVAMEKLKAKFEKIQRALHSGKFARTIGVRFPYIPVKGKKYMETALFFLSLFRILEENVPVPNAKGEFYAKFFLLANGLLKKIVKSLFKHIEVLSLDLDELTSFDPAVEYKELREEPELEAYFYKTILPMFNFNNELAKEQLEQVRRMPLTDKHIKQVRRAFLP